MVAVDGLCRATVPCENKRPGGMEGNTMKKALLLGVFVCLIVVSAASAGNYKATVSVQVGAGTATYTVTRASTTTGDMYLNEQCRDANGNPVDGLTANVVWGPNPLIGTVGPVTTFVDEGATSCSAVVYITKSRNVAAAPLYFSVS